MKINKKSLTTSAIVFLILSSITFILIFNQIITKYNSTNYLSSINECSYLISNIGGKSAFFNKDTISPNSNLINSLAITCPSKTIKINDKEIETASNLIKDCWDKSSKGENIFPNLMKGDGICMYCGRIKSKSKILNFNEKLSKDLNKKNNKYIFKKIESSVNLNSIYLNKDLIPKNTNPDRTLSVFYYTFKPEVKKTNLGSFTNYLQDVVLRSAVTQFGQLGNSYNFISNNIFPNVIQTYSTIIITDQKEYQENEILNINRNNLAQKKCTIIIPKKNYE